MPKIKPDVYQIADLEGLPAGATFVGRWPIRFEQIGGQPATADELGLGSVELVEAMFRLWGGKTILSGIRVTEHGVTWPCAWERVTHSHT